MNAKKETERIQLTKFISNSELRLLVYGIEEYETPDFILKLNDKRVSVEHTRLINPKLQQVEQYKEKIIENARKLFREKYDAELYVLITFDNIVLKSGKVAEKEYSKEVFKFIETIYLNNREFDFDISTKFNSENPSELINDFSVSNNRKFENWQHFGCYLVEEINYEWLKSVIKKKEKNISKYPEDYDEDWLLLVCDFGTEASTHSFNRLNQLKFETKFDKIYIYNYMPNKYCEIK